MTIVYKILITIIILKDLTRDVIPDIRNAETTSGKLLYTVVFISYILATYYLWFAF